MTTKAKPIPDEKDYGRLGRDDLLELFKQCVAELHAIDDIIFDATALADDVEHHIACHADTLPIVARTLAHKLREVRQVTEPRRDAQMEAMEAAS